MGLLNSHPQVAVRDGEGGANRGSGLDRPPDPLLSRIDSRHEPLRVDRPDGIVADREIERIPARRLVVTISAGPVGVNLRPNLQTSPSRGRRSPTHGLADRRRLDGTW